MTGCNNDNDQVVSFTIENMTEKKLEYFKFYAGYGINGISYSDSIEFVGGIEPGDSSTFTWSNPNLYKSDGSFYIRTNDLEYDFGYFSNGNILKELSEYTLKVYSDSIK